MTGSPHKLADVVDIEIDIDHLESEASLFAPANFEARINAIDFIEFHIIDRINSLLPCDGYSDRLLALQERSQSLISDLRNVDTTLSAFIREGIANGQYSGDAFKQVVAQYVNFSKQEQTEEGYDNLDLFVNDLFPKHVPDQTKDLESEMVFYQKTPARVVFEIADKIVFTGNDVFYDLGSGLGQVGILLNLLTGATTKGIEYEPAFYDYAIKCAKDLYLTDVHFINADVRHADLRDGNIFFMYTPFKGDMMQEVLEKLSAISRGKKIKVITYGPCTPIVAKQNWLQQPNTADIELYKPAFFCSK